MTLQQLKYIIEIVNCGSMNLAAQKLFVSLNVKSYSS